jgi:hypothetical protein
MGELYDMMMMMADEFLFSFFLFAIVVDMKLAPEKEPLVVGSIDLISRFTFS